MKERELVAGCRGGGSQAISLEKTELKRLKGWGEGERAMSIQ